MTIRTSLVGGATLGVLIAATATSGAYAKPHAKHARHAAPPAASRAEVDALKAEVQALESWREQETAARQQDQQQLQDVQGKLADAQARADKAEAQVASQIETIPTQVNTAVAKATPKPGWWANTSVSGRMYYDFSHIDESSNLGKTAGLALGSPTSATVPIASGNKGHSPNGVNFDIKRFYVSVDHTFNSVFSADVTSDFLYDYTTSSTQFYIKKAYLQAKLSDALIFQVGAADQPWIPFVEDTYGYRYVEFTLIDRTKFGTSADWGLHAQGKVPVGPATFGYNLAVTNGMGYKTPGFIGAVNRSSTMDFEGRVNVNWKGLTAAVGGYEGKLGQDYSGTLTFQTAARFDALLAYSDKWFRLGGEYMWARADTAGQITSPTADNSFGYGLFGNVNLTPQISIFGRYDWVRPQGNSHPSILNSYYNVGISYEPVKIVDFALVYKHDRIDRRLGDTGTFADQNFGIANTALLTNGTYDEVGLFGQFRW
ncbi:MAG: hypothetical protein JO303_01865 [Caulobacteraceae bacterium]|nr:hypothetical protein [Caulobacteraceae bacterium]